MKRLRCSVRNNWQDRVTKSGLSYHTHDQGPYWLEGVYYEFSSDQIDQIEAATNDLHMLCIEAAGHVIKHDLWERIGIPRSAAPFIISSWERDDFSLYGRFDLAYDGVNPPKMLEYNADTPTALVEAAVAQCQWREDIASNLDQFNSLHEALIAAWRKLPISLMHFTGVQDNLEDNQTVSYLMDTAQQAGLETKWIPIDQIAYSDHYRDFIDEEMDKVFTGLFKLYPYEWLFNEEFGQYLNNSRVRFVEPGWKALLSNKGLLPILWELFPDHPNLLPAYNWMSPNSPIYKAYVKKPLLSREGANVSVVKNGMLLQANPGEYGEEGYIYQSYFDIPTFHGTHRPVIGSWIINHEARGMGIREDQSFITGNLSTFVPHVFI